MPIFKKLAPLYYDANLPAIPLLPGQKRPAINNWSIYGEQMPTVEEQAAWLDRCGDGNIGLPLGPCSGLVAFDIDTENPNARRVLDRILPPSPWVRVGKKGEVRMYRYSGERTTRIQDDKGMICEILSKGSQVVLPGSIHPDTGLPYTANANLWDVLTGLPSLPDNIVETLWSAFLAAGIKVSDKKAFKVADFVPAGARNNTMTAHAGLLARAVTRGERTLLEALDEMQAWVDGYVEKVIGDVMSVEDAKRKVIQFVLRDVQGPAKKALPVGWDDGLSKEDKERLGLDLADGGEKWTVREIIDSYIAEIINHKEIGGEEQLQATNTAMERLARSMPEIDLVGQDRIMNFIVAQSGGTIKLPTLRRKLRELQIADIAGENHNEIAKAALDEMKPFGDVRHDGGRFWQWNGSHWREKLREEINALIGDRFGNFPACRKDTDYRQVVRHMGDLIKGKLASSDIPGINFANGYLDQDLHLHTHDPRFGATYVLPYCYRPDEAGRSPRFNQFLNESWGGDPDSADKMLALQEMIGATMFGVATRYQRAFCLYGVAGSGKSVASDIVQGLLPLGSVSAVPPEKWSDKFLPAEMFGKVMNFAGELSEKGKIPGDIFKQVVEGGLISGQFKNKDPFEFRPVVAQWFNSNHLPKSTDSSRGFVRRWQFLDWTRAVPEDKRITGLADIILAEEREAIAAWAVDGLVRLRKQDGYTQPSSHTALVNRMAAGNNSVRYFLTASMDLFVGQGNSRGRTEAYDLYEKYWSFCLEHGVQPREARNGFMEKMRELPGEFDFKIDDRAGRGRATETVYVGIEIVTGGSLPLRVAAE